MLKDYYH